MQASPSVKAPSEAATKDASEVIGYKKLNRCKPLPAQSGVQVMRSSVGIRYRAHLVIKGLRLYTNTSSHIAAMEHHIVFVQMRDALAAETAKDLSIWTNPHTLLGILDCVLAENNTSAARIGLHVFVYMRGTPWLNKDTFIVSAVMQLHDAVPVYARLLHAQCTSWEALRAEWVNLLLLKRKCQAKCSFHAEEEMVADQAWQKALNFKLCQAEKACIRAMKHNEQIAKKAYAIQAREQRRSLVAGAKAEVLKCKEARQQLLMRMARRMALRQRPCKDMTMEDIMYSSL